MTEMTATAQLQAWLDGTAILSKAAVRTVLWDLAEARTQLEQGEAADSESVAGRVAVWLDGWERYYRELGLPEDAVLIAGPPPGAEPRTSAANVRFVLNALSITLKRYAETKTVLGDALELLSARADGTPHIVETTIGLDPFSPDAPHWTVHHPLQCHRLSYGEGCEFDVAVDRWGLRSQFPLEVGRFEARIEEYDGAPGAELMLERLDGKAGPQ